MSGRPNEMNTHDCPNELWEKMTDGGQMQYNRWIALLTKGSKQCKVEDGKMIEDVKILAHNAIIMIHPDFNKITHPVAPEQHSARSFREQARNDLLRTITQKK